MVKASEWGGDLARRLAEACQHARHSWRWVHDRQVALAGRADAQVDRRRLDVAWERARARFVAEIDLLNQEIDAHNADIAPGGELWPRLDAQAELQMLGITELESAVPTPTPPDHDAPPSLSPSLSLSSAEPSARAAFHQLVTIREKIPHTPRWEDARKRALWRYLSRLQQQADKE